MHTTIRQTVFLSFLLLSACDTASLFERIEPDDGRDWLCLVPGKTWVYTMEMDGATSPQLITNHLVTTSVFGDSTHVVLSNISWLNRSTPQVFAWYKSARGWRQHYNLLLSLPAGTQGITASPSALDLPFLEKPWVAGTTVQEERIQIINNFRLPPENLPTTIRGVVRVTSKIEGTDIVMDAAGVRYAECLALRLITEIRLETIQSSGPWTNGEIIQTSREELLVWLAPGTGIIRFEMASEERDIWNRRNRTFVKGELYQN